MAMLFALHTSRVQRRTLRLASVLFVVALELAVARIDGGTVAVGALEVLSALLLAVAAPAILRRILTTATVTGETILGALDVYIMFGLFFAAVYLTRLASQHHGSTVPTGSTTSPCNALETLPRYDFKADALDHHRKAKKGRRVP
jgi:hypothetical protein